MNVFLFYSAGPTSKRSMVCITPNKSGKEGEVKTTST